MMTKNQRTTEDTKEINKLLDAYGAPADEHTEAMAEDLIFLRRAIEDIADTSMGGHETGNVAHYRTLIEIHNMALAHIADFDYRLAREKILSAEELTRKYNINNSTTNAVTDSDLTIAWWRK